jgi:periplasmic divalent cation tolerance protein
MELACVLFAPVIPRAGRPALSFHPKRPRPRRAEVAELELMKRTPFKIVLVTTPDVKTARRLARAALETRLIACANLVPKLESHYRWQGKLERSAEVLMVMKTTAARLGALEKLILTKHPYDTPEFVVLNLAGGAKKYLAWLAENCR